MRVPAVLLSLGLQLKSIEAWQEVKLTSSLSRSQSIHKPSVMKGDGYASILPLNPIISKFLLNIVTTDQYEK